MAFELRLTFSGLTALVPNKKASDPKPAQEYLVVMPDLKAGKRLVLKDKQSVSVAPHQALLLVNAQAIRPGTTKDVRLRFRDPQKTSDDKNSELLYELDRELLEIGSGAAQKLEVRSQNLPGEVPEIPDQYHDIKWVPPIDKCHDDGVPLKKNLFDPQTLRPQGALACVVRLDRGKLEVNDVYQGQNEKKQLKPVHYEFRKAVPKPDSVRLRQALAKGFRLRVNVGDDSAQLLLTDHKGNPKKIIVGPYKDCPMVDGVPLIEVKIFNQEMEEVFGFVNPSNIAPFDPNLPPLGDTDFAIFYWLSPVWDTLTIDDLVLPYLASEGGGGSPKPCEPPIFPGTEG
jgi:hypothetical protein